MYKRQPPTTDGEIRDFSKGLKTTSEVKPVSGFNFCFSLILISSPVISTFDFDIDIPPPGLKYIISLNLDDGGGGFCANKSVT